MIIAQDIDFTRDCFHASRIGDYGQVKRIPCGINRQARTRVIHAISGLDAFFEHMNAHFKAEEVQMEAIKTKPARAALLIINSRP